MSKWSDVKREHVIEAVRLFDTIHPDFPSAKSTFLIYNGKKYPAKHIRGMAYEVAHKVTISKEAYTGGMETQRFFKRLGFEVEYHNRIECNEKTDTLKTRSNFLQSKPFDVVHQKNALQILLQKHIGTIETEKKFPWLKTPDLSMPGGDYGKLLNALTVGKDVVPNIKSNYSLLCDIVISDHKIIIEYDERQHFSLARKTSLQNYPESIKLFYDKEYWITSCEKMKSVDNFPPGRDEVRAFYDSVRDIEAYKNGYILIRLKHGDYDWLSEEAGGHLSKLLKPFIKMKSDSSTSIEENKLKNKGEGTSTSIKIGRAILNLNVSKQYLDSFKNGWIGHKSVLSDWFKTERQEYINRLVNIRNSALENKVQILLLPACTAVYGTGFRLNRYYKLFEDISWTITGTFNSDDWDDENLMLLNYGRKVEFFDSGIVKHLQMDSLSVMTAISSTITGIKKSWDEIVPSETFPPLKSSKVIALDSGHHQYNGRYTMSLEAVLSHLKKHYKRSAVILSYWRFKGGAVNCPWVYANKNIKVEREEIEIKDTRETDILDMINY